MARIILALLLFAALAFAVSAALALLRAVRSTAPCSVPSSETAMPRAVRTTAFVLLLILLLGLASGWIGS